MADQDSSESNATDSRQSKGIRVAVSGLVVVPLLILWFFLATEDDSNIALVRNDVVEDASGSRSWRGTMGNTTDSQYRDISVTIRFLDAYDQPVGEVSGSAVVLNPGESFDLQAPLPNQAVAMQVYSLEWETGRRNKRTDPPLGPWAPWPFGHVQKNWP